MDSLSFFPSVDQFLSLDVPPLLTALFSSLSCALLGNFLLLRRISLMGDAISHAVLPGIVAAFLLSNSRDSWLIFLGAAVAGLLCSALIEAVRKLGRMESGASMGVVFSVFFALGVIMIEQAAARSVDLDADCLLHGQLESIFWFPPHLDQGFFSLPTLWLVPHEVWISLAVTVTCFIFVSLLYKELTLSAFDPELGTALGFSSLLLHFGLMIVVASAVVAAFSAVGSILVIAMIICPAATARLLTDKLSTQIKFSLIVAVLSSTFGYFIGAFAPPLLGWPHSVSVAGSMTVALGLLLACSVILSPSHGLIAKRVRNWKLSVQVLREDILGYLYRCEELLQEEQKTRVHLQTLPQALRESFWAKLALRGLLSDKLVLESAGTVSMTPEGREIAYSLVRSHRLWENYLVEEVGLAPDHIHKSASQLEHFTGEELTEKLAEAGEHPSLDPHGKPIPSKKD